MPSTTQLFNEVTTEFTGGNDLYIGSLSAATTTIGVVFRVETVQSPGKDAATLYFVTSPTDLIGLSIAEIKALLSGTIQEVVVNPTQSPGSCVNRSSDVYVVDGVYFAAWLETSVVDKVLLSAWVNEF